ncbi:MAG TPA: gamma carbonic anhydrase family protein [Ignavibacteria bacterium]|nr:gamma carbonic anhydrase family protein [Ignavibacteria bacterium]HMR40978.1 gamma carbonic anhydrase family protein [Ignavibacteria bacterium]
MLLPFKDKFPQLGKGVFIADTAVLIGDLVISDESSVWFNAVIRGDVNHIRIGSRTNIQDGSVLHVTNGKYPLNIGNEVTVGHNATVHGCTVKDNVLIGMGAVVLDNSVINTNSIVGAGSVIKENFEVPEGVLVAGVPAKIIRDITEEEIIKITQSATGYVGYSREYMIIEGGVKEV